MDKLKGKKTYLVAGVGALIVFAQAMGWITEDMANTIYALLGAAGLATLRSAVKTEVNK